MADAIDEYRLPFEFADNDRRDLPVIFERLRHLAFQLGLDEPITLQSFIDFMQSHETILPQMGFWRTRTSEPESSNSVVAACDEQVSKRKSAWRRIDMRHTNVASQGSDNGPSRVRTSPLISLANQRRSRIRTARKALRQLGQQKVCSGDRGAGVNRS